MSDKHKKDKISMNHNKGKHRHRHDVISLVMSLLSWWTLGQGVWELRRETSKGQNPNRKGIRDLGGKRITGLGGKGRWNDFCGSLPVRLQPLLWLWEICFHQVTTTEDFAPILLGLE